MNDVMPQPMGERTPMTQSLRDRAQDAIMCCAALAWRIGGNVLFGMTTALALQQVPLPEVCDLAAHHLQHSRQEAAPHSRHASACMEADRHLS